MGEPALVPASVSHERRIPGAGLSRAFEWGDQAVRRAPMPLLGIALAALLALPSGLLALRRGFDGLYGQDAFGYFDYATGPLAQALRQHASLPPFFWPPGYPLLVVAIEMLTGPVPLAGQIVSIAFGALLPVATFMLADELWPADRPRALVAGAIVAVCGQLWQSSIVVMADTTGLGLATLGAWCLARYRGRAELRWLVLASGLLAYATLARWIYGLVGLPFAVYAVVAAWRRAAAWHLAPAALIAGLILLPVLAPSLIGLLVQPTAPASFAGNLQVYSWSPLNALRRDFLTADGYLHYTLPNGVYYAIAPATLAFSAPVLAVCMLAGLWTARGWDRLTLVLVVGWAAVVYAFHAGAPWQNFRFTLAYLPPLALLGASGLAWLARRIDVRLAVAVGVVGLCLAGAGGVRLVRGFIDRKDDDLALVQWVDGQVPATAQVLSFGPTLTLQHYAQAPTLDLFELAPTDVDRVTRSRESYVLVDVGNLEDQWRGQNPDDDYRWLRDTRGLDPIANRAGLTLFRVHE